MAFAPQGGARRPFFRRRKTCPFSGANAPEIDYKDVGALQKLTTQQGKIFSRKRSGNCARHQRSARRAIKRARFLSLLPYVS